MTGKLDFVVEFASSESPTNPASHLTNWNNSTGWKSSDLPEFPVTLILNMKRKAALTRVQFGIGNKLFRKLIHAF